MNTTSKIIGGFLLGATVGTIAGILLAPESGKRTRRRIADESKRLSHEFADTLSHSLDSVKSKYNRKLDDYAKSGKNSIDQVKEAMKV